MDGKVVIGVTLNDKDFDREISLLESKLKDLEEDYEILEREKPFEGQEEQLRKLSSEIISAKKKISQLNNEKQKLNQDKSFQTIQQSIDGIGNSVTKTINKMGRWALAVFGIRSIYSGIRSAMGTLSQYDEQMAINVQYISYLLASILKPVIETIINLAYKLLAYVNYIAQAWFGVNLFANASTEAFEKNNKVLNQSNKQAKELKKTLAGFDEMNVLQDNGDVNSGGGSGVAMPSLPKIDEGNVPKWLQWIADNGTLVASIIAGIAGALIALKLGFTGLQALGIGLAITGILIAIQGLIEYLQDPSWENFGTIIQGIGIAIIGLGLAIFGLPVAVAGAIVLIVGIIIKYWDEIKSFLQKGIDWLTGKSDWVHEMFGDTIGAIYDTFVNILQGILDGFNSVFTGIKEVFDGIIKFVTGIFSGDWGKALEGLGQIFAGFTDIIVGAMKIAWSAIIEVVKGAWNFIVDAGKKAWDGLVGFISWIIGSIGNMLAGLGAAAGNIIAGAFKGIVNGILWAVENILNTPIRAINGLISVINAIPGINLGKLSTFRLPRLARGGIVNNPGPGVMMGSYIAGERGPEAVLPLNNETLDRLGEAIARHQNINATIPIYVGNRQIAREIRKINDESNFAFNR